MVWWGATLCMLCRRRPTNGDYTSLRASKIAIRPRSACDVLQCPAPVADNGAAVDRSGRDIFGRVPLSIGH